MSTKIDWCDETINPLGWGCYGPGGTKEAPKICSYCYAARMAKTDRFCKCELCKKFIPHTHLDRLKGYKGKKSLKIFVQSMGDLLGDWVEADIIQEVIWFCEDRPQHTFMFLTKNPQRYNQFHFPLNCWLGVTITKKEDFHTVLYKDGGFEKKNKIFISIEPLLGTFASIEFYNWDLIIVGAMTGPGAIPPRKDWIDSIQHPNIFYKSNLRKYL